MDQRVSKEPSAAVIVIECEECRSRFRLSLALFQGSKALRVRCRKCGGHIVVENPEAITAPEAEAELEPKPEPAPAPELAPEPPLAEDLSASQEPPPPSVETGIRDVKNPFPVPLLIGVLGVLLLAGGAFYLGIMNSGQATLGRLFPGWGSGRTGSDPARRAYDIRDVKWYVDKSSDGGTLFVIKGSVANAGKKQSAGIRIQATLMGKDNNVLAEQAAFAGNVIDKATLRILGRAGIEGAMSNRLGEGNVNKEIPNGKFLSFMVVFTNPPEKIESFLVKATEVE